jgi:hypothetical protein
MRASHWRDKTEEEMNALGITFYFGILIVLFCISSFVFPYGQNFTGKTQKIRGLGLDLEVSILTLLIIIGFVLIFFGGGIWLQLRGINEQLDSLKAEKVKAESRVNDLQEKLDRANSMELVAFIRLEDVDESNAPDTNAVECLYETSTGKGGNADVSVAPASGAFKIAVREITRDTAITDLIFRTKDKKRRWKAANSFMPFQPTYELKRF